MPKYRIKIDHSKSLPYIPQIWRWWFPFWRPLSISYGEGGSWWHTAYEDAARAKLAILDHFTARSPDVEICDITLYE